MAQMLAFLLGIGLLFVTGADGLLHWLRTGDPLRMLMVGLVGGGAAGMVKLLAYVRGIYHLQLGLPLDTEQVKYKVTNWPAYHVRSPHFSMEGDSRRSLVMLDREWYISIRLLTSYVSSRDYRYTFRFPGRDDIVLNSSAQYLPGISMFDLDDTAFVRLSALDYALRFEENVAYIIESASKPA
ncbi:hypothetical protein E2R60_11285 [Paenibacillus dendritiformis]|nr:hypothetical protein E2R60_11285 [Paenibacillus dendritiformis]